MGRLVYEEFYLLSWIQKIKQEKLPLSFHGNYRKLQAVESMEAMKVLLFLKDKSGSKFDFLNCFPVSTNWCEFFFILLSTLLEFNIFLPACVSYWNNPPLLFMTLPDLAHLSPSQVIYSLMVITLNSAGTAEWLMAMEGSFLLFMPSTCCMAWPELQCTLFRSLSDLAGE